MCHGSFRLHYWTKQPFLFENETAINVNYFHDLQYQQDSRHIAAQYYITRHCLQCIIDKCTKKLGLWTHSIYPLYHSVLEWLFSLFVLFCFFVFIFYFCFHSSQIWMISTLDRRHGHIANINNTCSEKQMLVVTDIWYLLRIYWISRI